MPTPHNPKASPEPSGLEIDPELPPPHTPTPTEPVVILVPERRSVSSALFLPPLILVLLGACFLSYRAASRDWRGFFALLEPAPPSTTAPEPKRPAAVETPASPAQPEPAAPAPPATNPPATVAPLAEADAAAKPSTPAPAVPALTPPVAAAEKPAPAAGALEEKQTREDIAREAEKTRDRIAELEKFKENQAKKLEETEDERRQADRENLFRRGMRFRIQPVPFEQVDKMIAEMRRQQEQFLAEHLGQLQKFERDFFENGRAPQARPRGRANRPGGWPPGIGEVVPRGDAAPGAADGEEKVFRTPNGGTVRYRAFKGPGGMTGYQMRFQMEDGGMGRAAPPPPLPGIPDARDQPVPPPPAPKVFD
ncbi:MAG: hypothetical protein U0835_07995 [Isosphaeraceae bacterium]